MPQISGLTLIHSMQTQLKVLIDTTINIVQTVTRYTHFELCESLQYPG